ADTARADVAAAQAGARQAGARLSYAPTTARIAGELGRSPSTQRSPLGPAPAPLARSRRPAPLRGAVSTSEAVLPSLRQQTGTLGAIDPDTLRFSLRLPNEADYPQTGQIEYISQEVDPQTGTVAVRVVFPNPGHLLLHNQYVTIVVAEEQPTSLPVVP